DSGFPFSPAGYLYLKNHNNAFSDVAVLSNKGWAANLTDGGDPERLQGFQVSGNLFSLLGVNPEIGRSFAPEEDRPDAERVVMLSHELWQRRFGGNGSVLGRKITLNSQPYTVIGVMPSDFRFYAKTDIWTPLALSVKEENERNANYLEVVARRKPGVSFKQAADEASRVSRQFINNPKSDLHARLNVPQALITKEVRPVLLLLFAAAGFVLLIACVNMANLTLARGTVRSRELAIRSALGAGRFRVVRQLLIESLLIATAGGAVALLLANWVIQFLA